MARRQRSSELVKNSVASGPRSTGEAQPYQAYGEHRSFEIGARRRNFHKLSVRRSLPAEGRRRAPAASQGGIQIDGGTKARRVVDAGVVQGYFLSSYSARKLGLKTTGHAGGAHNLRLSSRLTHPGDHLDEMLRK